MTGRDKVELQYRIQFRGAVHCGTGLRAGLVDHTVVRGVRGELRIPGSTVKGVVRRQSERLLRLILPPEEPETGNPGEVQDSLSGLVERLFGSVSREGTLFWEDALPEASVPPFPAPSRTRVSLSRLTRTAERGRLFTREHAPEGMVFVGRVHGFLDGPCLPDAPFTFGLPLLVAAIVSVDRLGGARSVGLGQCRVSVAALTVNREPVDPAALLKHLDDLEYYGLAVEEA